MAAQLQKQALEWLHATTDIAQCIPIDLYCQTRDLFQARLSTMTTTLLRNSHLSEDAAYLIVAIAGEIGNNSFDHNLGNWPDISGVFFGYAFSQSEHCIVLADRGQGILRTLQKVKPGLQTDEAALEVAFNEKISGRAPENRGNGLKFVRESVQTQKLHLTFFSGNACAELNEQMMIHSSNDPIHGCLAVLTF